MAFFSFIENGQVNSLDSTAFLKNCYLCRMITYTEENYLKSILMLSEGKDSVGVNLLSRELNIKMPTVTSMMKRLSEKGLVVFDPYKPIRLTEEGRLQASLVIRKHRLTETFLFEKMGLGWEQIHTIAEQIEHIQSPVFFDKMDELLNYPSIDPHGEPIPTKEGKIITHPYTKLSEHKVGETVLFSKVGDPSEKFLILLNQKELKLGEKIRIEAVESYDNSFTVSYGANKKEVFSKIIADKIWVE